jgi:plastocyanin
MHLEVFYASAVAWPWQDGSTFDCWRKGNPNPGTPCQNAPTSAPDQLQFDPGCSSPAGNESANSDWTCDYDTSKLRGYGDGNWYYCAVEADAAIPDHPGTPDQLTGATSSGANLSADAAANCGSVTLDTTPPSVEASASTSTVTAGQSVRFAATASDSGSGVDGTYSWNFGDGGTGSGGSPSHTFSSPGTYTVRASTADGVGNAGSATTTVTVTTASSSGHGGGNGTHGNGTSGNGTSGNGNSGNGNSGKGQPTKNTGSTKQTGRSSPPSCTVPRLSGRSLSSARTLLRRAHCATGAVREPRRAPKARPRRGRRWELVVAAQSARSGRRLRHGSKIGLTLRYREETK